MIEAEPRHAGGVAGMPAHDQPQPVCMARRPRVALGTFATRAASQRLGAAVAAPLQLRGAVVCALLFGVVWVLRVAVVGAQPMAAGLGLRWRAPAACPGEAQVRGELARLLGSTVPAGVTVDATVTHPSSRVWSARLVFSGAFEAERELRGDRCDSLAATSAWLIAEVVRALATAELRQPSRSAAPDAPQRGRQNGPEAGGAAASANSRAEAATARAAAPPTAASESAARSSIARPEAPDEPAVSTQVGAAGLSQRPQSPRPVEDRARAEPSAADHGDADARSRGPTGQRQPPSAEGELEPDSQPSAAWAITGWVWLDAGTLPGPAVGAGVESAVRWGAWRLAVRPRWLSMGSSAKAEVDAPLRLHAFIVELPVQGCYVPQAFGVDLGLCASLVPGLMKASASGVVDTHAAVGGSLAVEAALAPTLALSKTLQLRLELAAARPLLFPRLTVRPWGTVDEAAAAALRAGIGIALSL